MKIGFVLNNCTTESHGTSITIMYKASQMGHQVYALDVGDFIFYNESSMKIYGHKMKKMSSSEDFLSQLKNVNTKKKKIFIKELDVIFLRNNPTEENSVRHWAEHAGIAFGRLAQQENILVLNDADALSTAFIDKLYFEELPQSIKPRSIITRYKKDILKFWSEQDKKMVLKPLQGSGGKDVYLIDKKEKNVNQIIDTISAQGYVIAQEYIPEVENGDIRVFMMNGKILEEKGKKAIIRRVNKNKKEFRSNFKLGAIAGSSQLTPDIKKIIELTSPKLIQDGLFLVGLDIVKDKLIEINVLSPGGLERFQDIDLPDFSETIVNAIERKLYYKKKYKGKFSNRVLATME